MRVQLDIEKSELSGTFAWPVKHAALVTQATNMAWDPTRQV